jgi:hypothetical protein
MDDSWQNLGEYQKIKYLKSSYVSLLNLSKIKFNIKRF